jgi:MFS family permease
MHGVYLLWWVQERGVSPGAVAAILAAGDIELTALEVPTGWLADRFGHRACLIAGSALQIVGMLCCWLGVGIPGLLAACLLVALGDAFRSGADEALLYRSCVALHREADFQAIQARTKAATLVALVILVLLGGAVVAIWGFAVGWIVETALSAAGLVIACAMIEPPAATDETRESASVSAGSTNGNRSAVSTARFIALLLPAAWLGGVAGAAAFFAQTSEWATTENATVLVAIVTLAEALGAFLARRLAASIRMQLALAGTGTLVLTAAILQPAIFLPAVVVASALLGIAQPLRSAAIQRMSADDVRASAASLASALDKAVATFALVVAGVMPRRRM